MGQQKPDGAAVPATLPADHAEREELRRRHNVRVVVKNEEGTSVERLPDGVYGFTFAPHAEAPIFAGHPYHSYELHKVEGGGVMIIGFVSPQEASRLDRVEELTLYPDAHGAATTMVTLSKSRILKTKGPSREEGNGMHLILLPSAD